MVGIIKLIFDVSSMKRVCFGGSSKIFNSALAGSALGTHSFSALKINTTLQFSSLFDKNNFFLIDLIALIEIVFAFLISIL